MRTADLISVARKTIETEASALIKQARSLDNNLLAAIELILLRGGRVAVCGMGKSGHVGRKIAATLASTGTPAYFLHPAEASHGDLGMLGEDDVLLAISNSGKTAELEAVVQFAKRRGIPVIAMTHDAGSPLAKQGDICLVLQYEEEACPIGCAPTTSTTVTLALGDALSMALLQARGFTADDFHKYHPGGALGCRLLLVEDIMHTGAELPLVSILSLLPEILLEMTGKGFGCAGVVDEYGNLVGIITDGDLRRHLNTGGDLTVNAASIMSAKPVLTERHCVASSALNLMEKHAITSLFVLDNGKPAGIVHLHDCLRNKL